MFEGSCDICFSTAPFPESFKFPLLFGRFLFIQALRAFRRAEIVFDVVLFESCVGGVAVAMTVASIFYFEFWFLWGVR